MSGYWVPLDPETAREDPKSPDPMDWPDGPARRLALGHRDERDVPGYCTCGTWAGDCLVRPRKWSTREAHS